MKNLVPVAIAGALLLIAGRAQGFQNASTFETQSSQLKALVFLSSDCPCSRSHTRHLNALAAEFSQVDLYGVITDSAQDLGSSRVRTYFSKKNFNFPILSDPDQVLVKKYDALKTPHVVLLRRKKNGEYARVYEGGVSDKRQFDSAGTLYLKENFQALSTRKSLPYRHGRCLGCYIRRL